MKMIPRFYHAVSDYVVGLVLRDAFDGRLRRRSISQYRFFHL